MQTSHCDCRNKSYAKVSGAFANVILQHCCGQVTKIIKKSSIGTFGNEDIIREVVFNVTQKNTFSPRIIDAIYECGIIKYELCSPKRNVEVKQACKDLAQHLMAFHAAGVIHGDIKPQNVLYTSNKVAQLIDFSSATYVPEVYQLMTTIPYRAPEVMERQVPSTKADVWSLAVTLFEIMYGCGIVSSRYYMDAVTADDNTYHAVRALFDEYGEPDTLLSAKKSLMKYTIKKKLITIAIRTGREVDEEFIDFIAWMLEPNPILRLSAMDVFHCRYLADTQEYKAVEKQEPKPQIPQAHISDLAVETFFSKVQCMWFTTETLIVKTKQFVTLMDDYTIPCENLTSKSIIAAIMVAMVYGYASVTCDTTEVVCRTEFQDLLPRLIPLIMQME
jgi:serine/threonine protein kinase